MQGEYIRGTWYPMAAVPQYDFGCGVVEPAPPLAQKTKKTKKVKKPQVGEVIRDLKAEIQYLSAIAEQKNKEINALLEAIERQNKRLPPTLWIRV